MDGLPAVGPPDGCPDQNTLVAFHSGRLSEPEMEALAGHVGTCAECERTLGELMLWPADKFEAGLLRVFVEPPAGPTNLLTRTESTGDTPLPALRTIGPYALVRELGRGGMGIVYRAAHRVLNRTVALKTLHSGGEHSTGALARFRVEGEVIARFDHPNIVRVYDFNEDRGGPYLTMELIEGETLAQKLTHGPLDLREAAELVRAVADAVGYAHQQNVIHRDLKPANVLVAHDGTPKVTDFGLAKVLDAERGKLTETDAVMGTPSYMAPEQAAGHTTDVDERADVYALGATLYELLTGKPPFTGDSKHEIIAKVQRGCMVRPSRHRPEVPRELEEICLKCLETVKDDRYHTAHELGQELGRWLDGRRRRGRRPNWRQRAIRVARRRTPHLLAGLLIAGAGATVTFLSQNSLPPAEPHPPGEPNMVATDVRKPNGESLPFRVRYGDEKTKVTADADGVVTVNTWTRCLVDYLPGPGGEEFTLRAEILLQNADLDGLVGLYFAHQVFPGTGGGTHLLGRVTYNDLRAAAHVVALASPFALPQPPPKDNAVTISLLMEAGVRDGPWSGVAWIKRGAWFKPCGFRGSCWRTLEVTVTPNGVSAAMDGQPVGVVPAGKFTEEFEERLTNVRQARPDDKPLRAVDGRYEPRGGVGLLIERGSASFRRVTVTPSQKKV